MRPYLFGPVSREFAELYLSGPRQTGECLAFNSAGDLDLAINPEEDWDSVRARLPAGWQPDFIALYLPYACIPRCLWSAPIPLIGLAADWNLLWHHYRFVLRRCDWILTDARGVEVMREEGFQHTRAAILYGYGKDLEIDLLKVQNGGSSQHPKVVPQSESQIYSARDIDVLFAGNLHPAVQRDRLRWLGRLTRLRERWNVQIHTGVFGKTYRELLARARIVFNRATRGEANQRTFEAIAAGALLFQEEGNLEVPHLLRDRQECICYNDDNLEMLLDYYLEQEAERAAIAQAGQTRAREFSFEKLWQEQLRRIESDWETISERASRRIGLSEEVDNPGSQGPRFRPVITIDEQDSSECLNERLWSALSSPVGDHEHLIRDLAAALVKNPQDAELHVALGLAVTMLEKGSGPVTGAQAEKAAGYFQRGSTCDPSHPMAGLNLVEALVGLGKKQDAIEQAKKQLNQAATRPGWIQSGHFPPSFDLFRVEWERGAWDNAGRPAAEARAKHDLWRWRLYLVLAELTGDLHHYYEAALARPDLAVSQAALGCALGRSGRLQESIDHLQNALADNPFDLEAARALFQALGMAGDGMGQRRLARDRRMAARVALQSIPLEDWFIKVPPVGDEPTSIIILCCNQLPYTQICLQSVFRHTRCPYELIIVDNGSTDGTQEYLEELARKVGTQNRNGRILHGEKRTNGSHVELRSSASEFGPLIRIQIIRNEVNRGYPAGCNQGIASARGSYLVFLNNDTVLTEQWLEGLIAWSLYDWPKVGMVGPVTNQASPPQKIAVDYAELDGLEPFASRCRQEKAGQAIQVHRLTGFCLLVRREVLERVGVYDEQFELGFFDDDDLCVRAREAGFNLLVAQNVYIHHFGNRTFRGLGIDCPKQLLANFERFKIKWGTERSAPYRLPEEVANTPLEAKSENDGGKFEKNEGARPTVSLCMIVKNEERNLPACLEKVTGLFHEILIADTGSADDTLNVAARLGAKVIQSPWQDSFAVARNECQRHATGEWIFWLDADDRIDADNLEKLHILFRSLKEDNAAFCINVVSPATNLDRPASVSRQIRLFRNLPGLLWQNRVHEQILPGLRQQGAELLSTDIVIEHVGYQDEAQRIAKSNRNLTLLNLQDQECPGDPYTLFHLGGLYLDMGRPEEALSFLERSLERCQLGTSWLPHLYLSLAQTHHCLGQNVEALSSCQLGRALFPEDGPLLFAESTVLHKLNRLPEAEQAAHQLLAGKRHEDSEEDPSFRGYRGRHLLASIYRAQGKITDALVQWRHALAENPHFAPACRALDELNGHESPTVSDADCRSGLSGSHSQNGSKQHTVNVDGPGLSKEASSDSSGRATVSLCMILKNEEENLPACLESAPDLFDEVIVVDTGSTDRTRERARALGAKVVDFPWVDSFAAARNECLRIASNDFIFWLDADDRLDATNRLKLKSLLESLTIKPSGKTAMVTPGDILAYSMKCLCLPDPRLGTATVVDHVRLFRRQTEIHWQYRVHEQILPSIRKLGGVVKKVDVVIQHVGYQDAEIRQRKHDRDLRLLQMDQAEHPDDPFILFNLGWIYAELGQPDQAIPLLRKSLSRSEPGDSIVHKLFALIAQCHRQSGQLPEALQACQSGRQYYPDDVEILFQEGLARQAQGDRPGAEGCWLRILGIRKEAHFGSVDVGLSSFKTRHNLALLYRDQGRFPEAEAQFQATITEQPEFLPGWIGLGELLLSQRRLAEFQVQLRLFEKTHPSSLWSTVLRAKGLLARQDFLTARSILEESIVQNPNAVILWIILSHTFLQEGKDWPGANRVLRKILELDPGNAEARQNLTALLRQKGWTEGADASSKSLVAV